MMLAHRRILHGRNGVRRRMRRFVAVLLLRAGRRAMERRDWRAAGLLFYPVLSIWKHPLVLARLGTAAARTGRFKAAVRYLRLATAAAEPRPAHQAALASVYRALGYISESRATVAPALDRRPNCAAAHLELGRLCHIERRYDDAVQHLEHAVATAFARKRAAIALVALAEVYKDLADRDATVRCALRAASADPMCVPAYQILAQVDFYDGSENPHVARMEALLREAALSRDDAATLHFVLGRLYDRCQQWDRAFANFARGNAIRRRAFRRALKTKQDVRRHARVYTRERLVAMSAHGAQSDALVFVVGMPRSGTTLLEQILDCHPAATGLGERTDIFDLITDLPRRLGWAQMPYPECVEFLPGEVVSELSHTMLAGFQKTAPHADRIITKRPDDVFELGLIHILFPRARILYCKRNALDTCLSCYVQDFVDIPYASTLEDICHHYRAHLAIMDHWRSVLPAGVVCEVRYEELVRSPRTCVDAIVRFCGLTPCEHCLEFSTNRRPIHTASAWQVRRPLYVDAIGRAAAYMPYLGPLRALVEDDTTRAMARGMKGEPAEELADVFPARRTPHM